MTADEKTERDAGSIPTDQIGKVFVAVGHNVRQCLVCEQLFTRRASAEHANVVCRPVVHRACDYSARHLLCESLVPLVQEGSPRSSRE
jgi:hypothetical protein